MFMERALFWAERGRGRTSPNPIVGAIVVSRDGVVVGQGAHLRAGGPHAEVHALNAAGQLARGATLYCTLEPCCHVGRTGPCVDRVIEAGIARVVVAVGDPNPKVAGKGFEYLRQRGVRVDVGIGQDPARRQNEPFFTWVRRRRPFVVVKSAISADGFVGRADARVKLTGPTADRWFQRQRAEIDAIAVGSRTVLVDDPLLTAREVYRARPLVRVLFDWRMRIPASARVFDTAAAGPVVVVASREQATDRAEHVDQLSRRGIEVWASDERTLEPVLARLADRGIVSVLVEGGPSLQQAFADAGFVDHVQRVETPHRLGAGVGAAASVMRSAEHPRRRALGDDLLIEFDVHGTH